MKELLRRYRERQVEIEDAQHLLQWAVADRGLSSYPRLLAIKRCRDLDLIGEILGALLESSDRAAADAALARLLPSTRAERETVESAPECVEVSGR
ncbi:MAG TPA: hypothetical protein VHE35_25390 [Kofleriaceae bacterium]|nr:hypothetical protein [Kofleriaceae bacterium]